MTITRNKKWVSDAMLLSLFQQFEACTSIVEGGLEYRSLDFKEFYEILPDAFSVKPSVSRQEAIDLFAQALRRCRRENALNVATLLQHATAIQKEGLAIPLVPYTLWTKFRAKDMAHFDGFKLTWRGVTVSTASVLPAWLERDDYVLSGVGRIFPGEPAGYGYIILTCEERTEDRAVNRMMDALQLMLGLQNLYEAFGKHYHKGGRKWTAGRLWAGPNQFVFRGEHFCGEERIWYNPDYDEEAWELFPLRMDDVLKLVPQTIKALEALEQHPLRDLLVRVISLMQDGFVARDSSLRLLRYWSALEQLYVEADAKNGSNEKVIGRATFAETEPEVIRWKLEHIARLRNDYVHAGASGGDLHDLSQFLRELLSRHIHHWIFRGQDIPDHGTLLQLVKLPSDKASLKQMRELIDRRLNYLETAAQQPPKS